MAEDICLHHKQIKCILNWTGKSIRKKTLLILTRSSPVILSTSALLHNSVTVLSVSPCPINIFCQSAYDKIDMSWTRISDSGALHVRLIEGFSFHWKHINHISWEWFLCVCKYLKKKTVREPWKMDWVSEHIKGTSRGPEALHSHLNDCSYTNVLCWP